MKIPVVAAAAAFSVFAHAVPVTNSNGSVMTPNSDLARGQPVATDVSGLLSSESDPNVAVTNGELWVRGERVETGSVDPSGVRGIVDSSFAGGTQAVNRAVSDRRDRDDLRVYRRVRDVWTWRDWPNDWATTNAPADFLAAANSPGAYPLAYREATGSWMYANQYWPNGNLKYDASMPPGSAASGGDLVLNFRFVARAEDGVTELFRFGATATRESATDGTLVDWETDGPPHGAPVRVATTDLVGMELARKAGRDELVAATNGIRSVDGAARPLPKYLYALDFADSYTNEAAAYYRSRGDGKVDGGCSAVRDGNFLYRNFDFPFDGRAEFVVKMAAGAGRFASVGVAQVGTNLTERMVTSGRHSRCYKWLPGATVDGVNENGVVCEINVVDTDPPRLTGGDIHPLAAVRWALDNGTSAEMVATSLASRVMWPSGWAQNFHWMVADAAETWIVENGTASNVTAVAAKRVMTNFPILPDDYEGMGKERYDLLRSGANITNAWFTNAYRRDTDWASEFKDAHEKEAVKAAWETYARERLRGLGLWQSVHTSVYDIANRTLRVAVQETDDWYAFAVPSAGGMKPETVREIAGEVVAPVASSLAGLSSRVSGLQTSKRDMTNLTVVVGFGWLDLPPMSEVRVKYDQWGDPEGNHWLWQGRDEDRLTRNGTKPGTYYFWPTAEAASNAVEVSWDYPDEIVARRGTVTDSIALSSSVSNLSSRISGLQSSKLDKSSVDPALATNGVPADAKATGDRLDSKLDIGDAGTLGRFLGTYEYLGTERCRTDMAVGDVVFVKVQGTDVGQYARIVNAKAAGDVLEIADARAIPSADFPTPGFAALLGMADPTLTVKGRPADARATGDRFDAKLDKSSVDPTLTTNGVPADAAAVGALPYMAYNIDDDGIMLEMLPAHYDSMPYGIAFTDYDLIDLPSFQAYGGSIYGYLSIINLDSGDTGFNGDSITVNSYDGSRTTINPYGIFLSDDTYSSANLSVYGFTINEQTTYSLSSINYYGNSLSFPFREGTFALVDSQSLSAMLIDANTNQTADRECISTNLCKIISAKIDRKIDDAVNANMNTYVDGETGVEYVGKFYGGSFYYVPTGNVYPPNN